MVFSNCTMCFLHYSLSLQVPPDPKIDLILRVEKILKNLTVAPPVCFFSAAIYSQSLFCLGWMGERWHVFYTLSALGDLYGLATWSNIEIGAT